MTDQSQPGAVGTDTAGQAATRTSIVIPACNHEATIAAAIANLRGAASWHEIIVVDDGSRDGTAERAAAAGARVVTHPRGRGYGAAVKSGLREATGDFVLVADGAGRLRPADARRLVSNLEAYELVVGTDSGAGQAAWSARIGLALLAWLATHLAERRIPDLTSTVRAARRSCWLEFLHLLPSGPSAATTTTLAFLKAGYSVLFVPLEAGGAEPAVSAALPAPDDAPFLVVLLKIMTIFSPLKIFAPVSALAFLAGGAYAIWTMVNYSHVTNSSVLLIVLGVVVFLVGLVSEQISALRFEGRRL